MLPSNAPSVSIFEATTIFPSAALTTAGRNANAAPSKKPRARFIGAFCAAERLHVEQERRLLKLLAKFLLPNKTQRKNRTFFERICFLSDTY